MYRNICITNNYMYNKLLYKVKCYTTIQHIGLELATYCLAGYAGLFLLSDKKLLEYTLQLASL